MKDANFRGWTKAASGLLLAVLFSAELSRTRADRFEWSGEASSAELLRIDIREGDITVLPSADERIRVSAVKRGRARDLDTVRIETRRRDSVVEIQGVHAPRGRSVEAGTRVRIDVEVRLPAGVRFIGKTRLGDIEASGIAEPLEAYTDVGDIRIRTASWARGRTTNGNIRVSMGRVDWQGSVAFETTNGSIDLTLPRSPDVELSVSSTNGRFRTDLFPVPRDRYGIPGERVSGSLGEGSRRLRLRTVNGDIDLRRAAE